MKYQIKVWKEHKQASRTPFDETILKPHVSIKDVAYWQARARKLLPDHHVTCLPARNTK